MRILIIDSYYPQFLEETYKDLPGLKGRSYDAQMRHLLSLRFAQSDALSWHFRDMGHEAAEIIVNAEEPQLTWARENGCFPISSQPKWHPEVLRRQILSYAPDVLFVQEMGPVPDDFWASIKASVGILAAQVACTIPPHRSLAAFDLILSSWPPLADFFRARGQLAEYLPLGFDHRVLQEQAAIERRRPVTFIGGLGSSHPHRTAWLDGVCRKVPVEVWGYVNGHGPIPDSIARCYRGPAWGRQTYQILAESQITLNAHEPIAVNGCWSAEYANNMRLFEATGMGCCLITDRKTGLDTLFHPGDEILTYHSVDDCVDAIRALMNNPARIARLGRAAQQRTLTEHTLQHRCERIALILERILARRPLTHTC